MKLTSRLASVALLLALAATASAQPGRKFALLIGVNEYSAESGLSKLSYAEADVADLAEVLRLGGYQVTLLTGKQATRSKVADAARAIRKQLKAEPVISSFGHYLWKDLGIEIGVNKGIMTAVFLFAEGADENKQYRGDLPQGLRFSDTRGDIERKLGQPAKTGGGGVVSFWVEYPELGLSVSFASMDTEDKKNKIHHVTIQAIDAK